MTLLTLASDLGGWTHDLNPIIFTVFGLSVRWYGLSYLAGIFVGYLLLRRLARRNLVLIPAHRAEDFVLIMAFGIIIGGRLGYCLFYEPDLLWTFDSSFPFWGVLMIARGGMASHGGMIGVILAAWRISRGFRTNDGSIEGRTSFRHVADVVAALAPFGLFFGRLANFVNGELLGKIVALPGHPAPWWAVRYPQELLTGHAPELSLDQTMRLTHLIDANRLPGEDDAAAVERMIARIQHGAPNLKAQLEPLLAARHPSQLYQAAAEGLILGLVLWWIWRKPRTPGVIGCWFLIIYGVLRVVTEVWRLPDDNLAVQRIAGLSRGQWLSVVMVLAGAAILFRIRKLGGEKVGGWMTPRPAQAVSD
ncbi:MAG: prolipoprotein diacylglyceryl transferase [Leptolyngbya sp. PLA3]|nr:MAG: prolipoprotein diacylglyceryl transferase [Cyanobacteria bacterium CYA]MCE7969870.1 prolipoprotein diacylglyceryl transferase [Leptolyngbya sp. PL-A3]